MAKSSYPSQPSSREHSLRRMSHGSASDKPIRSQLVVTLALGLLLVAVPLYLLRRPDPTPAANEGARTTRALGFGGVVRDEVDGGVHPSDVLLGPLQRVRCGASATQTSGEGGLCDSLPLLEAALRQAIVSNVDCVARSGKEGSINYVLEADFTQNRLNVFAGKSGQWRGARAKKAVSCVLRSLPPLGWTELAHQHQYYAIAMLASYPAAEVSDGLPTFD
jgi:hypothetical protein